MFRSSRRIFWYWLLLLLPTLAVGTGALLLLRREQAHLATRAASTEQARRAALEARARLIAENVDLLIGDVQDGLLDALAQVPEKDLGTFLDLWQKNQPLVRVAFVATVDGQFTRPLADEPNDEAKGFLRRFKISFAESPPWKEPQKPESRYQRIQGLRDDEEVADRTNYTSQALNASRVQSARREVKALSKISPSSAPSSFSREKSTTKATESSEQVSTDDVLKRDLPERRGWALRKSGGRMHVVGWLQPNEGASVRGVELEMTALIARLGGALPADVEAGEGFALRDEKQRILHQVGLIPRPAANPLTTAALSSTSFPGWEVIGFLEVPSERGEMGEGFFLIGALLVGILIIAILSGGSLLLWQARRSEAEAEQKTSFVANVSHEFKTPLTSIRLYAELLEQGRVKDEQKQSEYLRTIGRETQRLARLVNNALDFSRLEQGRKKYRLETVDVGKELIRLLDTQQPRLTELAMKLSLETTSEPSFVETDRDAFEQIMLNLLDNACKYGSAGREISIRSMVVSPDAVAVSVADRGPGVPLEHRKLIFEKFHRVDETLTAEKTGAGLGLSIARQLAHGIGGDLRYEAREGGGAMFILTLPRPNRQASDQPMPPR